MKRTERTKLQRAVDGVVTQAMVFHFWAKDSELPKGKGVVGKLLRACARLEKLKRRNHG